MFHIEKRNNFVEDDCQMTVMGRIILRFFYKVWFFGAVYFCMSWLFIIVSNFFVFSVVLNSILAILGLRWWISHQNDSQS